VVERRDPADAPGMWCAVCGFKLDVFLPDDPAEDAEYLHMRPEDHPAIPASQEEVRGNTRCDFCDQQDTHIVLAPSFQMPDVPGHGSAGSWAACDECVELVRRRRWSQLATRVKSLAPSQFRRVPRSQYLKLYQLLDTHMTGEILTTAEWEARGRP
jgi:hypothetical protein